MKFCLVEIVWYYLSFCVHRANKHLDSERQRQEQLAQERLHAAQYHQLTWQDSKSENQLSIFLETVDAENDCTHLQEMALASLDLRHQAERIKLIKVELCILKKLKFTMLYRYTVHKRTIIAAVFC